LRVRAPMLAQDERHDERSWPIPEVPPPLNNVRNRG
jgi:hypothetical protein